MIIYSKEIDAYITKIKQDYQRQLKAGADKGKESSLEEIRNLIRGGGLDEWKRQNGRIINNGVIMAEEGSSSGSGSGACEPSNKSRASTTEPSGQPPAIGTDGTPRLNPSMFTAINRLQEGGALGMLDGGASGSAHPSPMQTQDDLPDQMGLPEGGNVLKHLSEWEGTRIADCLGGVGGDIQGFSYGDVPDSSQLFGQMAPLLEVWKI